MGNPAGRKRFFLVDSAGAFVTTILLFFVLRAFNDKIGISREVLTYLSIFSGMICIYSLVCFLFVTNNWRPFLGLIVFANILYCCLTIALIAFYASMITTWGVLYFTVEVSIIVGLVFTEIKILI